MDNISFFFHNFGKGEALIVIAIALIIIFVRERHRFMGKKNEGKEKGTYTKE